MKKNLFVILAVACFVFAFAAIAQAYQESPYPGVPWGTFKTWSVCEDCHGAQPWTPSGPHGGYTNSTDKCASCHVVHEAQSSNKLLPASTEFEICNSCHDMSFAGTGGRGVYGAIRARAQAVAARHDIQGYNNTEGAGAGGIAYATTDTVPGSNNIKVAGNLSCSDCHTPHGNTRMASFLGERARTNTGSIDASQSSNHLLQDDLATTTAGTYSIYGSAWCAACHNRRHQGSPGVNNHPTDNVTQYASPTAVPGFNSWQSGASVSATFPLGRGQVGWSREATPGWQPLCQQCHEDYREVRLPYQVISADGTVTSDNPRFQTFPHETLGTNMLVETGDDLCLNCHATNGLP